MTNVRIGAVPPVNVNVNVNVDVDVDVDAPVLPVSQPVARAPELAPPRSTIEVSWAPKPEQARIADTDEVHPLLGKLDADATATLLTGFRWRRSHTQRELALRALGRTRTRFGAHGACAIAEALLLAEGELCAMTQDDTLHACLRLTALTTPEANGLRARYQAQLAAALLQLAIHFPRGLSELGLSVEDALGHAVALSEIALAADAALPDGHAQLARALWCFGNTEAEPEILKLCARALALDAEHDPARILIAVVLLTRGDLTNAEIHLRELFRRGCGHPLMFLARARWHQLRGEGDAYQRDLRQARRLAPHALLDDEAVIP